MNVFESMQGADFVVIDDVVFETAYIRLPDEAVVPDDVVLEARRGDLEVDLTRAEVEDAVLMSNGIYRLKSGTQVRFLNNAVVH